MTIIILSIIIITNKSLNDEEHLSNYISKRIIKNNFNQLNPKQRQCIILREYLNSIPSDELYKKRNSIWDIFKKKEFFRKSFQSFSFLILQQVSNFQEKDFSYINYDLFNKMIKKLKNTRIKLSDDLKKIIDNPDINLETENQKVDFLRKALIYLQNLFVTHYYANIDKFDGKINTMKIEAEKNYQNKIQEIQKSYKNLLLKVTELQKKKEEIKLKINSFDKNSLEKNVNKYKIALSFMENLKKNTPNFNDNTVETDFFYNLEEDTKSNFGIIIPDDIKLLFKKVQIDLKTKIKLKKEIDSEHVIVDYFEMVKGLCYEKSLFNRYSNESRSKSLNIIFDYGGNSLLYHDDFDFIEYSKYKNFIEEIEIIQIIKINSIL